MDFTNYLDNYNSSVPEAIGSIMDFFDNVSEECQALLDVIPSGVSLLMVACLTFTVILAIKRMVLD